MTLLRFGIATLLAGLLSSALADEYQDAVTKAFPGFKVLGPSETKLNKEQMNPEIYTQAKDHPGLVVGRFNSDALADFAALIRGSKLIHIPENQAKMVMAMDYYEGYLVVCLGQAQGRYKCTKMEAEPMRILVPNNAFLVKISPKQQYCLELETFRSPKPRLDPSHGYDPNRVPSTSSVNIAISTDAIGLFQTLGSGDVIYVHQPNGMYQRCTISD